MCNMLCIICNESPEKNWPKRWQCWKDNGKFSESLCKLLGLPIFPYKTDFQNSQYCSSCQKRVYNVYLIMRKWEKLQDDIGKLKNRLKKDFQQSLQKGTESERGSVYSGGEENDKSGWSTSGEYDRDAKEEANSLVRKRILRRMERKQNGDCDCCYEPEKKPLPKVSKQNGSQCDFPDCQDKDCRYKWKQQGKVVSRFENEMSESSSDSEWSTDSHEGNECNGSCKICNEADKHAARNSVKHEDAPCSSQFCSDCSICKDEARKSKEIEASCKKMTRKAKIECYQGKKQESKEALPPGSDGEASRKEDTKCFGASEDAAISEAFSELLAKKLKEQDSPVSMTMSPPIKKERPDLDEATTQSANDDDETNFNMDNFCGKTEASERFRCHKMNCTRTFVTQEELDIHVKRYHEGVKFPYECKQCKKAFQWRRELNAHVLKHSGEVAICCDLCGRGFRTQQLFNVHVKTKHGGERKFKCSMCEKSFISESKLNTHLTIHTKVYPFMCTICGKGFSAKTFLNFHMSKHMDANPYQCKTCGKTFSSPRNLTVHQYTHTKTHPFKCNVCEAGATSETMLKKHMLKHDAEKANTCMICSKKFRFPSSLKKHQKVHNGEKHFLCEFCNKTFIDKYKLTRHLRTHSGDKPFICTTCKRCFGTKEYLNKHIQKSHDSVKVGSVSTKSLLEPTMELPPIQGDDLQLPEINESLKAYLPDGFPTDRSFLDTFNPADEGLVVTALDLENFSKDELRMTQYKPGTLLPTQSITIVNQVPNSRIPELQSMRTNMVTEERDGFQTFTFQQL